MGLQDAAGSNSLHTPPRSPSELFGAGLTPKVVGLETGASGPGEKPPCSEDSERSLQCLFRYPGPWGLNAPGGSNE